MSIPSNRPIDNERWSNDQTIYKPLDISRVALPNEEEVVFEEEQRFDQVWLWAILGIELFVILIPLILTGQPFWTMLIGIAAIVMSMALLGSLSLMTRIDSEGVHYRMKVFHWKFQTIPWEDIDQIYVRKYAPIGEYGGWGIRYGRGGKAFNVRGNEGIQIIKKNGKKILLGTQMPEIASEYLNRSPLLV